MLIIFPVKAFNRRIEKTAEIIERLKKDYKDFVDLSFLENEKEFLESTGCLIFDHNNRKVYCCYSDRATVKAVNIFMETLNKYSRMLYEIITFIGSDINDKSSSVYLTNS